MIKYKITLDPERCKACYLCIKECPKEVFEISEKSNKNGYFYVNPKNIENCIGCVRCALICPDTLIEINEK